MSNPKIKIVTFTLFLLLVFAVNNNAQITDDEKPIKINTLLLNVPVIASDRNGRNIIDLTKEDFIVTQNGERQIIEYFANTEAPMNVAIVIDSSQSTRPVLGEIKKAARNFLLFLAPEDKAMIVSFDQRTEVLTPLTDKQNKLKGGINRAVIAEDGGSDMYDAIYQVLTREFASVKGRKAIIVLTDGMVGGRKITRELFLDTIIESDTIIYPIYFQTALLLPSHIKTITMDELVRIPPINFLNKTALMTGGRLYAAKGDDFSDAFEKIAAELKKQYLIGFYPKDAENLNLRNINIKVDRPDVVLRTKTLIRLKNSKADNK